MSADDRGWASEVDRKTVVAAPLGWQWAQRKVGDVKTGRVGEQKSGEAQRLGTARGALADGVQQRVGALYWIPRGPCFLSYSILEYP